MLRGRQMKERLLEHRGLVNRLSQVNCAAVMIERIMQIALALRYPPQTPVQPHGLQSVAGFKRNVQRLFIERDSVSNLPGIEREPGQRAEQVNLFAWLAKPST